MPVKIKKLKNRKVQVSTPNMIHSKATSMAKALKQRNLLNAIEHNPDFKKRLKGVKLKGIGEP